MPLCPSCDSVYLEGVLSCPDCGVPLLEEPPLVIEAADSLVEIYACGDLSLATTICSDLLRSEGILGEVHDLTGSGSPWVHGERRVAVPAFQAGRAVALIQAAQEDGEIPPDGIFLIEDVVEAPRW